MSCSSRHGSILSLNEIRDDELLLLRAAVHREIRRRGLGVSVGQVAERLAISFYNKTPGLSNLKEAAVGTANVDALSRRGHRYSIKGILNARKTGTVYPDADNPDRQLFEYLIVVKLNDEWTLEAIHEFSWSDFVEYRKWDKRMNAWYLSIAAKTLAKARAVFP